MDFNISLDGNDLLVGLLYNSFEVTAAINAAIINHCSTAAFITDANKHYLCCLLNVQDGSCSS